MTGDPAGPRTEVRTLARIEGEAEAEGEEAGDGAAVRVGLVETPKGERLELASDRGTVRLDAVALECLAYQDRRAFESFFDDSDGEADAAATVIEAAAVTDDPGARTALASITNEFAHADVRTLPAPASTPAAGDLLELVAPKAGLSTRLTAAALERVSARSQAAITELVRRRVE